jgi:DNA-binding HxlR family transcriptional regulator
MAALDLMGRRWALRILWELRDGPMKFRELQARCGGPSPTIVSRRLAELRAALLIEQAPESGYRLTELGTKLGHALEPLKVWSDTWELAIREVRARKKS